MLVLMHHLPLLSRPMQLLVPAQAQVLVLAPALVPALAIARPLAVTLLQAML